MRRSPDTIVPTERPEPSELPKATKSELQKAGWTEKMLQEGRRLLERIAQEGQFLLKIPRLVEASTQGLQIDLDDTVQAIVTLPEAERKKLMLIAAGITAGGIALAASPAGAEEFREITTSDGAHAYSLGENVLSYKVTVNGQSANIEPAPGFTKVVSTQGEGDKATKVYVYKALEPAPIPQTISVPASKSAEVVIDTETKKTNAIDLSGGRTELQFQAQEGVDPGKSLNGILSVETALTSSKTSSGERRTDWSMPLTLQLLGNRPDKNTGLAVGLSTGIAVADSKLGRATAQLGKTYAKDLRPVPGKETVLLLSYDKPTGMGGPLEPVKANVYFLSAYGAGGKAEGGFTADLRVTEAPKSTPSTEVFLGMGLSARGMTQTASEHRILDFPRVTVRMPEYQGTQTELTGALESNIDTGDTAVRFGVGLEFAKKEQKKPARVDGAPKSPSK